MILVHQRAFLHYMGTQNFSQCGMKQVRGSMMHRSALSLVLIDRRCHFFPDLVRQLWNEVCDQFIFFFGIRHAHFLVVESQYTRVTHLSATFRIEWCAV